MLTVSRSAGKSLVQDYIFCVDEFSAFDKIARISISFNTTLFMYSWMYYLHDSTQFETVHASNTEKPTYNMTSLHLFTSLCLSLHMCLNVTSRECLEKEQFGNGTTSFEMYTLLRQWIQNIGVSMLLNWKQPSPVYWYTSFRIPLLMFFWLSFNSTIKDWNSPGVFWK